MSLRNEKAVQRIRYTARLGPATEPRASAGRLEPIVETTLDDAKGEFLVARHDATERNRHRPKIDKLPFQEKRYVLGDLRLGTRAGEPSEACITYDGTRCAGSTGGCPDRAVDGRLLAAIGCTADDVGQEVIGESADADARARRAPPIGDVVDAAENAGPDAATGDSQVGVRRAGKAGHVEVGHVAEDKIANLKIISEPTATGQAVRRVAEGCERGAGRIEIGPAPVPTVTDLEAGIESLPRPDIWRGRGGLRGLVAHVGSLPGGKRTGSAQERGGEGLKIFHV